MTQQETRSDKATLWGFAGARSDELGHRIDVMIEMQVEIFDTLEEITRNWFARAKSEARLASELSTKLATARSLPDSASAYQEWLSRWMEMMTDDGRRLISDSQRLMQTSTRFLGNGHFPGNGRSLAAT